MKRFPLRLQIWFSFALIALVVLLLLSNLLPITLRQFFTQEIYGYIVQSQERLLSRGWRDLPPEERAEQQNLRAVRHFLLRENKTPLLSKIPTPIVEKIREEALQQDRTVQEYRMNVNGTPLLYVIRKGQIGGKEVYLVSYMWDTYLRDSVRTLFLQIMRVTVITLLALWLPSIWFAKWLSRPLVEMERQVKRIAERDMDHPIRVNRKDEIGRLAESIERMRLQLKEQDELQKSFLQHVSHELKTPIMVIRSYAQSIQDGIFPKGDLAASVAVISAEGERLEKRVRDLLYLSKLDYLAQSPPKQEEVRLDEIAASVVERLKPRRMELAWEIGLPPLPYTGDREQLLVLFENLVENQLRYAAKKIWIHGKKMEKDEGKKGVELTIGNDGPPIPEEERSRLFVPFQKGKKGEFGLGLAIVKRVVDLHRGWIGVENGEEGVSFHLFLPVC